MSGAETHTKRKKNKKNKDQQFRPWSPEGGWGSDLRFGDFSFSPFPLLSAGSFKGLGKAFFGSPVLSLSRRLSRAIFDMDCAGGLAALPGLLEWGGLVSPLPGVFLQIIR